MLNAWIKSLPPGCVDSGVKPIWKIYDPGTGKNVYKYISSGQRKEWEAVTVVRVDGGAIKLSTVQKCDYLFIRGTSSICSFIELKGRDLSHACAQIYSTYSQLKGALSSYQVNARIVVSRVPTPDLRSSSMARLKTVFKNKGDIIYKTRQLIEDKNGVR